MKYNIDPPRKQKLCIRWLSLHFSGISRLSESKAVAVSSALRCAFRSLAYESRVLNINVALCGRIGIFPRSLFFSLAVYVYRMVLHSHPYTVDVVFYFLYFF